MRTFVGVVDVVAAAVEAVLVDSPTRNCRRENETRGKEDIQSEHLSPDPTKEDKLGGLRPWQGP